MRNNSLWNEMRQTLLRNNSIVLQLIAINVAVFLLISIARLIFWLSGNGLDTYYFKDFLGVPSDLGTLLRQPWTLVTHMFTHGEIFHILFNMLLLYWFGTILTEFMGVRKILPVYLLGGFAGALLFIISYQFFPVFNAVLPEARAWGASASAMAIMVAAATLVPDYVIFLIFLGPVKIKWIALVTVVIDLISIPSSNAGGHIAHLGGALFGFFFVKQMQQGRDLSVGVNWLFDKVVSLFENRQPLKVSHRNKKRTVKSSVIKSNTPSARQEKLDSILDKIALSGYESLSKEEKEFLFLVSKEEP